MNHGPSPSDGGQDDEDFFPRWGTLPVPSAADDRAKSAVSRSRGSRTSAESGRRGSAETSRVSSPCGDDDFGLQHGLCLNPSEAVLVAMTSHAFQRRTAMRHREAIKEAQANTKEATEAQDLALVVQRPKTHSSASRSANTTPATSGRSLQSHASLDRATDHRGEGMGVTMTSMPELAGSQWVTSDARAVHAVLAGKGPRQGDASRPRAAGTREADVAQAWDDAVAESTRGAEGVRAKWLEDIRRARMAEPSWARKLSRNWSRSAGELVRSLSQETDGAEGADAAALAAASGSHLGKATGASANSIAVQSALLSSLRTIDNDQATGTAQCRLPRPTHRRAVSHGHLEAASTGARDMEGGRGLLVSTLPAMRATDGVQGRRALATVESGVPLADATGRGDLYERTPRRAVTESGGHLPPASRRAILHTRNRSSVEDFTMPTTAPPTTAAAPSTATAENVRQAMRIRALSQRVMDATPTSPGAAAVPARKVVSERGMGGPQSWTSTRALQALSALKTSGAGLPTSFRSREMLQQSADAEGLYAHAPSAVASRRSAAGAVAVAEHMVKLADVRMGIMRFVRERQAEENAAAERCQDERDTLVALAKVVEDRLVATSLLAYVFLHCHREGLPLCSRVSVPATCSKEHFQSLLDSRGLECIDLRHQKFEFDTSGGPLLVRRPHVSIVNGWVHFKSPGAGDLRGRGRYDGFRVCSKGNYIEGLRVTGCLFGSAVVVEAGAGVRLRGCNVTAGHCGVRVEASGARAGLSECRVSDCGHWGVMAVAGAEVDVEESSLTMNYGGGIYVAGGSRAQVERTSVSNNGTCGVQCSGDGSRVTVRDGDVAGNHCFGFRATHRGRIDVCGRTRIDKNRQGLHRWYSISPTEFDMGTIVFPQDNSDSD